MLLFADKMYTAPSGSVYTRSLPFRQQVNKNQFVNYYWPDYNHEIPLVFFYKDLYSQFMKLFLFTVSVRTFSVVDTFRNFNPMCSC